MFYSLAPDPWIRIFLQIRIQEANILRIQRIWNIYLIEPLATNYYLIKLLAINFQPDWPLNYELPDWP